MWERAVNSLSIVTLINAILCGATVYETRRALQEVNRSVSTTTHRALSAENIRLLGANGVVRAALTQSDKGTGLILYDANGTATTAWTIGSDGTSQMTLGTLVIAADSSGGSLRIYERANGAERLELLLDEDLSSLSLVGRDGRHGIQIRAGPKEIGLSLKRGARQIQFEIHSDDRGITVKDEKGRIISRYTEPEN